MTFSISVVSNPSTHTGILKNNSVIAVAPDPRSRRFKLRQRLSHFFVLHKTPALITLGK